MTPAVSVVVPAYHSDATIDGFLESLRAQTFREFELVLVNSSPGDRTRAAVATGFPGATYVESEQRLLPHEARNTGVECASAPLLAFTDPDCRARPDWLERHVAAQEAGHELTTGAMEVAPEASSFERGVHLCKFWWALPSRRDGPAWVAPSANACYSRRLWETAGPFPDGFSGDARLSWQATAAGSPPWFVPAAVVEHRHIEETSVLWRERVRRGREFGDVRARHERWTKTRLAVTALSLPVLPPLLVARAGLAAARAGWGSTFIRTVPVQLLGQAAWCLGETQSFARLVLGRGGADCDVD